MDCLFFINQFHNPGSRPRVILIISGVYYLFCSFSSSSFSVLTPNSNWSTLLLPGYLSRLFLCLWSCQWLCLCFLLLLCRLLHDGQWFSGDFVRPLVRMVPAPFGPAPLHWRLVEQGPNHENGIILDPSASAGGAHTHKHPKKNRGPRALSAVRR